MAKSTMQELADYGQSVWLDYISRPLLETGQLKDMIKNGLRGMTSNPSIFNQSIGSSTDYDAKIIELKGQGKTSFEIYDDLSIRDIQDATDQFKDVYKSTKHVDGYVSLEINPLLANSTEDQIAEGVRLFEKVNRPNVMIKVPATPEGIPVVEELISRGINVNTTLIFSVDQYEQVAEAYLRGLYKLAENGGDISKVHSVASVFISRIDAAVDKILDESVARVVSGSDEERILALKGRAAVANARMIFESFRKKFGSQEFHVLYEKHANIQRVLWASTSTKDPKYSDVKYVEELIVKPTVNTIPSKTLDAFLDHGKVKEAFSQDATDEQKVLDNLQSLQININDICKKLLDDGVTSFNVAFEELLASIETKAKQLSVS